MRSLNDCKLLSFSVSNRPINNEQLVFEAHRVKFEYELHEMRTNRLLKSMPRSIDQCFKLTSFGTTSRFSNSLISLVFSDSWQHLSFILYAILLRRCPVNYTCLPDAGPNPDFGYTNFDHMGWSLVMSFQLLTMDFWENIYNKVDTIVVDMVV